MEMVQRLLDQCNDFNLKVLLKKLSSYQEYFHFLSMDQDEYQNFLRVATNIPEQVKSWYKLFNGGYLFDTTFLSTAQVDWDIPLKLLTFSMLDDDSLRKKIELPKRFIVFAISSFGDIYCFSSDGSNEIIQWSVQEHTVVEKWSNFALWLNQEISTAIELIGEDVLMPLGI